MSHAWLANPESSTSKNKLGADWRLTVLLSKLTVKHSNVKHPRTRLLIFLGRFKARMVALFLKWIHRAFINPSALNQSLANLQALVTPNLCRSMIRIRWHRNYKFCIVFKANQYPRALAIQCRKKASILRIPLTMSSSMDLRPSKLSLML